MSEAVAVSPHEAKAARSKGFFEGTSVQVLAVLGVAVVAAVAGWGQVYTLNNQMDALRASFTAAGLDPASPRALGESIALKQRELTRVESALVSKSAAVGARDQQLAKLSTKVGALETAAAAATKQEREASATFAELDAQNRDLFRKVSVSNNEAVAFGAAAAARRSELDQLIAQVKANAALIDEAAVWREKNRELTASQEQLQREVTRLGNSLVSLSAAVAYRQKEVNAAAVQLSDAKAAERQALLTAIDLRAEADRLTTDIAAMSAEHTRIAKELVQINNRFVPAQSAVLAREKQLTALNADVAAKTKLQQELTAANAALDERMAAADERVSQLATAAAEAAKHLTAIQAVLGDSTVQAALTQ